MRGMNIIQLLIRLPKGKVAIMKMRLAKRNFIAVLLLAAALLYPSIGVWFDDIDVHASSPDTVLIPDSGLVGGLANMTIIFTGKQVPRELCNGAHSGNIQSVVVVYRGGRRATTNVAFTPSGVNPGTRVSLIRDLGICCFDSQLGPMHLIRVRVE